MKISNTNITLTDEQVKSVIEQSKKKKGFFKPEKGEKYFGVFVCDEGYEVAIATWHADKHDFRQLSEGRVFKTEQEAEKHKLYLEALQRVRLYIMENHYFEPDCSDYDQYKYFIEYHINYKELVCMDESSHVRTSLIQCVKSKEACEDVIKNCEEDLNIIFNV